MWQLTDQGEATFMWCEVRHMERMASTTGHTPTCLMESAWSAHTHPIGKLIHQSDLWSSIGQCHMQKTQMNHVIPWPRHPNDPWLAKWLELAYGHAVRVNSTLQSLPGHERLCRVSGGSTTRLRLMDMWNQSFQWEGRGQTRVPPLLDSVAATTEWSWGT